MQPSTPLGVFAAAEGVIIMGAAAAGSTPGDPFEWISTLGPFSVAIGLSYYLLRRSDSREAINEQQWLERERELREELIQARADLAVARKVVERLRNEGEAT